MTEKSFWSSIEPEAETGPAAGQDPSKSPSDSWRESIFESPPRLEASRSTTRMPVPISWSRTTLMVSGAHERATCLLVDHLWAIGLISRWKPQPLCLSEIGGPACIPDVLIELRKPPRMLHFIQTKAKRFVTREVQEEFDRQRAFCVSKEFGLHVWTNHDVLNPKMTHTLNHLERGSRNYPEPDVIDAIREKAATVSKLGELLHEFGWDDVLAAASQGAFFFDVTQRLTEATSISRTATPEAYEHLFLGQGSATTWWDSISASTEREDASTEHTA